MRPKPTLRGFAGLLWRLADLVRVAETRRSFRSKAYRKAIWSLDDLPGLDVPDDVLLATPGVGPGVSALIREYRETGGLGQLIPLEEAYPGEAPRLRRLPRMTPRILRDLKAELGVETVADLAAAIESDAVATVRGVGPQTLDLWQAILTLAPDDSAVPAHRAWVMAVELGIHLARHTGASVEIAGDVRRVEEWASRLDLVTVTTDPGPLADFLGTTATLESFARDGAGGQGRTHGAMRVVFHITSPAEAGNVLIHATGPPEHLTHLGEGPARNEAEVYSRAGLTWIPPPARGLEPEVGARVVTVDDLKGDLHLHSESSPDGRMTLDAICAKATHLGYEYVLITDHTQGLGFGGLDELAIADQAKEIGLLRLRHPGLTIFHGAELNIGAEGTLDLSDEALMLLDFAVAGIHSHFGLESEQQTARVIAALGHSKVRVLAHPFGRRIGIRPPLSIDMDRVVAATLVHGVALETNGHRDRLDLPADWVRRAASVGAVFAANSDGHRLAEMDNVAHAVATLQRAGITTEKVINTWDVADLETWLGKDVSIASADRPGLSGEGGI